MGRAVGWGVVHEFTPDQARASVGRSPASGWRPPSGALRCPGRRWPRRSGATAGSATSTRALPRARSTPRSTGRRCRLRDRRERPRRVSGDPRCRSPDLFAELNAAFHAPSSSRFRPHGPPSRSSSTITSAPVPRSPADHRRRGGLGGHGRRAVHVGGRRTARCAGRPGACGSGGPGQYLAVNDLSHGRGRSATSRPAGDADRRSPSPRSLSVVTMPACAPRRGSLAWRQHQAARPVLRRRRADARLPYDPGPRRPAHDQRPAVQGRRAGLLGQCLHRADQDPSGRPRLGRLPDQPQPHPRRGAWAESVPNLEIETNDVRCSHASTVGPIDDEQLFYIESRGCRRQWPSG